MNLRPAVLGSVQHICLNLRASDVREAWALRGDEPTRQARLDLANHVFACGVSAPWAQVAALDEPVAVFIAAPRTPTTCDAIFLATERWCEVSLAFSRHAKRVIMPALKKAGITRVEARVWKRHEACRWVEWLGAQVETVIEGYGKGGESFVQYAWRAS